MSPWHAFCAIFELRDPKKQLLTTDSSLLILMHTFYHNSPIHYECQTQSAKVLALPCIRACQVESNTTPQPICEYQVAFLLPMGLSCSRLWLWFLVLLYQKECSLNFISRNRGYHWNCLYEYVVIEGPKSLLAELGIHQRLEYCDYIFIVFFSKINRFGNLVILGE